MSILPGHLLPYLTLTIKHSVYVTYIFAKTKNIPRGETQSLYSGSSQLESWSPAEPLALCSRMQSLHRLWHQLMSQLTEFFPNACAEKGKENL